MRAFKRAAIIITIAVVWPCAQAAAQRGAAAPNPLSTHVNPIYFLATTETPQSVFDVFFVSSRSAMTRSEFEATMRRLNPNLPDFDKTFAFRKTVVLPDPERPSADFGWFTPGQVDGLVGSISNLELKAKIKDRLKDRDYGAMIVPKVTDPRSSDRGVWAARNTPVNGVQRAVLNLKAEEADQVLKILIDLGQAISRS